MPGLADAFLNAPFIENGWDRALRLLAETTGSARGQLIGIGGPAAIPFNLVTDTCESALRQFVEIDGGSPARNYRVAASRGPMTLVHEEHYRAARRQIRDDTYSDFCRAHDIPHGIQTVLDEEDGLLIGLSVNRTEREGQSSADERALFAAAVPHALRAVRIQQAMGGQAIRLLEATLEQLKIAAFVLDSGGLVRAMTGPAERALRQGVRLDLAGGRLQTANAGEQQALDQALAAALARPARAGAVSLSGTGEGQRMPAVLAIHPIALDEGGFSFAPRAIAVLREEAGGKDIRRLRAAHGLTAAEAAVAMQLAQGLDREEIALARGTSAATVHSQIKAIFDKMDVRREVELVLGVLRLTET